MRKYLCGCAVDCLTMEESIQKIKEFIESGKSHQHVVVNVNKIIKANNDENLKNIINNAALINCDGMPLVWLSRIVNKSIPERVAGIDLFMNLVKEAHLNGWSIYFLGAKEEVVTRVVDHFKNLYPGLRVAGYRNGYWDKNEEEQIIGQISEASPDMLFLAIPSPQKEYFLNRNLEKMNCRLAMGVGGSFDVVSNVTTRAPKWMQDNGLEWFYRFIQEPRRLFKRYFVEGLTFLGLAGKEVFKTYKNKLKA